MHMKVCTKCKVEKELTEFNKGNDPKTGLQYKCKECLKNYRQKNKDSILKWQYIYRFNNKDVLNKLNKDYRINNSESIKNKKKEYYDKNSDVLRNKKKEYYNKNKDKIKESGYIYRNKNKNTIKEKQKKYYIDNKEKITKRVKEYAFKNREKINKNQANRKQKDSLFKLRCNVYNLIYVSIKKQGYSKKTKTFKILGCSFEEFKSHLEKQFVDGMTWNNMGKWHLDHIYPVSLAKDEEELIKLNHYTNFQPLWATDNIKKSNKI